MYEIKKFEPTDMFSVIKLASDTLTEKYHPSIFNYFYETFPKGFIVCKIGQKIVGFIIGIKVNSKKAKILMLSVSEYHRKKRIGQSLLYSFENEIKKIGINDIELEVRIKNKKAIKFYQKHGYKIEEKIKDYYQNSEDAYIMKKYY